LYIYNYFLLKNLITIVTISAEMLVIMQTKSSLYNDYFLLFFLEDVTKL
jgi:hypothetical protein